MPFPPFRAAGQHGLRHGFRGVGLFKPVSQPLRQADHLRRQDGGFLHQFILPENLRHRAIRKQLSVRHHQRAAGIVQHNCHVMTYHDHRHLLLLVHPADPVHDMAAFPVVHAGGRLIQDQDFRLHRQDGGQRQRVALASILAVEPDILILDEPTTGLDYLECCHIMDRIRRMNEEKQVTVLMVCHDMEVVLDYARRALVMAGGRLLADGPVREIFRNADLMEEASILPPQMIGLSLRLGEGFEGAATTEEMAEAVMARRKEA